jgi:hypothetical protein
MRRALSSLTFVFAFVFFALGLAACSRSVTTKECSALLDRFVQLKIDEDPATKGLTGGALDSARLGKVKAMQNDSDVQQIEKACEVEVSRNEYDCAIKATTSKAWNDCIE